MNYLDLTLPSPAENLACDEALLDSAEAHNTDGLLRFWEPAVPFVVLGYANKAAAEVRVSTCRENRVPILRRCSGGGTILQAPGCLNYSVILRINDAPELQGITATNCFVMQRNRAALAALLGQPVTVEGHTDLAIGGMKFSGNAQRRKRTHLLFHGTFLLAGFDLALIERYLLAPPRQPEYRRQRSHLEFLTRLPLPAASIKDALKHSWNAHEPLKTIPQPAITKLAAEKYSNNDWNLKW